MAPGITMMDYGRGTIKARDLKRGEENVLSTLTGFLLSYCVYIASGFFIVVGHKLFYVPFKNATIDFIIIIVNTLFLYIIRMSYTKTGNIPAVTCCS